MIDINIIRTNRKLVEDNLKKKYQEAKLPLLDEIIELDKKVSEEVKAKWGKLIERYLNDSEMLKAVFLLVDIRHEPSANDRNMYEWIVYQGYDPIIIATKLDKINRSQIQKHVKMIKTGLGVKPGTVVIPFSATTKQGREEIWELITGLNETTEQEN